jgi:hypothetical protein
MKPGYLDLPIIWRNCDWLPVNMTWSDENGRALKLNGWEPRAYSRHFNLNATVTDPAKGKTRMVLSQAQTSKLNLGKDTWDWVWVQTVAPYVVTRPVLRGTLEVKDPVTDPTQTVLGRIGGGSVYSKVIPGTGNGISNFCLIGNYDQVLVNEAGQSFDIKPMVESQLKTMYANGQRQISLALWFIPSFKESRLPEAEKNHYVNGQGGFGALLIPEADWYDPDGTPHGAHLWPPHQKNLLDILQLLKTIGFKQVKIGYAPQGRLHSSQWGGVWQQDLYVMVRNFMLSVTRLVNAHRGGMEIIYDLGGEFAGDNLKPPDPQHPLPSDDDNRIMRQYAHRLWETFCNEFGPARSSSFGVHAGSRYFGPPGSRVLTNMSYVRCNYWLDLIKQFDLPYPGYYRTEGYATNIEDQQGNFIRKQIIIYEGLTEVYRALKDHRPRQDRKPILIGETFYNNLEVAHQIEQALADFPDLYLKGFRQWPVIFGRSPGLPFPDVYPKNFFNYRTI